MKRVDQLKAVESLTDLILNVKLVRAECKSVLSVKMVDHKVVVFDMGYWVTRGTSTCQVCLAGCMLLQEGLELPAQSKHQQFYLWLNGIRFQSLASFNLWSVLFDWDTSVWLCGVMPDVRLDIYDGDGIVEKLDQLLEYLEKVEKAFDKFVEKLEAGKVRAS